MTLPRRTDRRSLFGIFALLAVFEVYSACVGNEGFDGTLGNAQFALTCGTCVALDQCHHAGTCNPETGYCSNPANVDGHPCDDGNLCTTGDACQAGVCASGAGTACTALDQCHTAGTCQPATGLCSTPSKLDATACDDSDLCTQTDTCQGGVCSGGNPKTCTAAKCQIAGTCAPATGVCSTPTNATNGSACNDGNLCTQTDSCMNGSCMGSNPKSCSGGDVCNSGSTCDPATGSCGGGAPMNEGGACTDGNKCTIGDKCTSGTCTGAAVNCTSSNPCQVGACDGATGSCVYGNVLDNTTCNDGKTCTTGDKCMGGTCVGNVSCPAIDMCHDVGSCAADNSCTKPIKTNGAMCDYEKWVNPNAASDRCATPNDVCMAGACVADTVPIVCPQLDCNTVACNKANGNCVYSPVTPGATCGVTGCYSTGTCSTVSGKGQCSGTPKDCAGFTAICKAGICDASTGACGGLNATNGVSCAAADKCVTAPTCQGGSCIGEPKTCTPKGECGVSMCNPSTGDCDEGVAPVGTACTAADQCRAPGSCDATGACVADPIQDGTPCVGTACPTSGVCVTGACICVEHSMSVPDPTPADQPTTKPAEKGCSMSRSRTGDSSLLVGIALLALAFVARRRSLAPARRR